MNQQNRERQIEHLVSEEILSIDDLDELVAHIASNREAIAELDLISTALTGQPSTLKAETDQLLTCDECLDNIEVYVEARLAGKDVTSNYPKVAYHLQHCADCQTHYEMLYELVQQDAAGEFGEWHSLSLWETGIEKGQRLIDDICLLIVDSALSFSQLSSLLTPQLSLVDAQQFRSGSIKARKKEDLETTTEFIELLKLPDPAANLTFSIATAPVIDNTGAFILAVSQITPAAPLSRVKVTLCDQDGRMLERTSTDHDGLVYFKELTISKYIVQIGHMGQQWEFSIVLQEPYPISKDP